MPRIISFFFWLIGPTASARSEGFFRPISKSGLFAAHRGQRINASGALCWNVTGEQRNDREQKRDSGKGDWVRGAHTEQKASNQLRKKERCGQTKRHARKSQRHPLPDNKVQDVAW